MKHLTLVSVALLATSLACSNADGPAFQGGTTTKTMNKAYDAVPEAAPGADAIPSAAPKEEIADVEVAAGPSAGVAIAAEDQAVQRAVELTLDVKLPSNELREGSKELQALAVLSRPSDSVILWSLEGPAGIDIGSIDANGKYTGPKSVTAKITVNIVATLATDQTITDKEPLNVIPAEQIFVGCKRGNLELPITSDVYMLAPDTKKLPDFSKMTKSDTVCLDKFDIPLQAWDLGFPVAPELQEWFALSSVAKINVPVEGIVSFKTYSDDGSIVYINGEKIVDNDGVHGATSKEGSVSLAAGKHDILLNWYQGPRVHIALQLYWKLPGSDKYVIVPTSAFSAK